MPSDSTHQMQLPLCLATVPEIHPHLPQPPSTSRPSCSWRITSGRRGRRGSAEAPTTTTTRPSSVGRCSRQAPSCLDRNFRVPPPPLRSTKGGISQCLSSSFFSPHKWCPFSAGNFFISPPAWRPTTTSGAAAPPGASFFSSLSFLSRRRYLS